MVAGVADLHAPLEDGQGAARGEWPVSILVAQDVAAVQLLVNVGVCFELVPWVVARLEQHAHPRILLILDLRTKSDHPQYTCLRREVLSLSLTAGQHIRLTGAAGYGAGSR